MRFIKEGLLASIVAGALIGQVAIAQRTPAVSTDARKTLEDIDATFGFVPQFFRAIADAQLPAFWQSMKTFEAAETALDHKTKELIGLAVASQIPCEFCVYFHTESARHHGANEQQIREAVAMAAMTRMGSTLLNGAQIDMAQFRKDTQRLMKGNGKKQSTAATR